MALEDAAVIGSLLSRLEASPQLPQLLRAYEALRRPRTIEAQLSSRENQYIFHLPDGVDQELRDSEMRTAMLTQLHEDAVLAPQLVKCNSNQWADKQKNMEQFSYDADEAADNWWTEHNIVNAHD